MKGKKQKKNHETSNSHRWIKIKRTSTTVSMSAAAAVTMGAVQKSTAKESGKCELGIGN